MRSIDLLLACCFLAPTLILAASPPHTEWYGQQRRVLTYLSENQCRYTYEGYEDGSRCPPKIPQYPIGDDGKCYHAFSAIYLANCLLNHLKEVDKADMANAAVLLGLLPTVLSMAGSSTIETGMLALRRPLLALLVSAGSPAVNPLRTFEYKNILGYFEAQAHVNYVSGAMSPQQTFMMVLEYVVAAGAVVNLITTSWELSVKTICATSMQFVGFPIIWTLLTIPVHIVGILAVYLRVDMTILEPSAASHTVSAPPNGRLRQFLWRHTGEMLKLSECQTPIRLQLKQVETELFRLVSWTVSTGTGESRCPYQCKCTWLRTDSETSSSAHHLRYNGVIGNALHLYCGCHWSFRTVPAFDIDMPSHSVL